MGLKEQLNAGSTGLRRDTVVLTLSGSKPQYTGSVSYTHLTLPTSDLV